MTSKNQYLRLFKEDMHRRTLSIVLSSIVEFLLFPVGALFFFQTIGDAERTMDQILFFLEEPVRIGAIVIAVCGAVICAYSSFSYLFHKKEVDLYHGLPYNRRKQFTVRYLNGYLVYLIPQLFFFLISLPIYMANAGMGGGVARILCYILLHSSLVFLLVYNLIILGSMLSGNVVNAGFLSLFIGIYALVMGGLIDQYLTMFLETYKANDLGIDRITHKISPITYIVKIGESGYELPSVIVIILMLILSYLLFVRREMEKAGMGGIYTVVTVVVRFCMTVLAGLGLGSVFSSANHSSGWLLFGIIFGCVVAHVMMNSLFNMSIKDALKGKQYLVIGGVVCILTAFAVRYDCFGYDRYLPSKASVQSVSLQISGIEGRGLSGSGSVYSLDSGMELKDIRKGTMKRERDSFANIAITENNDLAYQIAVTARDRFINGDRTDEDSLLYKEKYAYQENESSYLFVEVRLRLKNKGTVIRHYRINRDSELDDLLVRLYQSEEYKSAVIQASVGENIDDLRAVVLDKRNKYYDWEPYSGSYASENTYVEPEYEDENIWVLNRDTAFKLYQAYRNDTEQLSINQELHEVRTGVMHFAYEGKKGMKIFDVQISPAHTKTIEALKEYGYEAFVSRLPYDTDKIREILVLDKHYDEKSKYSYEDYYGKQKIATYTEQADVERIFGSLRRSYQEKDRLGKPGRYYICVVMENEEIWEYEILQGSDLEKEFMTLN